jgi:ABC-2 type transport system permease protein
MPMLRTLWSKTLRDYRIAILGWGIGLGSLLWLQLIAYTSMSAAGRAAEAALARSFRFFAEPIAVNTAAGYTEWHMMGYMPVVLGIWAVLAGARLVRGEEERGSLDLLLDTPLSRVRVLGEKSVAMVVALLLISCLLALGLVIGEVSGGLTVDVSRALLAGLNVGLCTFVFGAFALFLSQLLTSRAAAAGWAGGLMVLSYLLDGTGRIADQVQWVRPLTPLYYYNLSKPLIPSYGTNVGAMMVLLEVGGIFALASLPLFAWRDLGGSAWPSRREAPIREHPRAGLPALAHAQQSVFVRGVALRALRAETLAVLWWLIGLALLAGYVTAIVPSFRDAYRQVINSNPLIADLLGQYDIGSDNGLLAAVAFLYLPVLTATFALTMAMRWSHDVEAGYLELVLATPLARRRVYFLRFSAVAVALVLAPLAVWLSILVGVQATGLHVDNGHLAAAVIGMLPLELITAALVFLLVGWLRSDAVLGVATAFLALSFFAEFLQAILKLPDWVIALSVFHQYGSPMIGAAQWGSWLIICLVAGVLLLVGVERFARSDLLCGS